MKNKVSIIIPVYNVEKYLEKCITSIIEQTYKDIEIILIDDGSTDNSGKICDLYLKRDKRIKVIHKTNSGVSSTRNHGLDNINGEYILFIDSDDYIENNMIELMVSEMRGKKADIVCCNYYTELTEEKKYVKKLSISEDLNREAYIKELINPKSISGYLWNKLYKKKKIIQNGKPIRFDDNIKIMEDLLYNLQVADNVDKIIYIDKPLYHYIQRDDSALNNKNILKMKTSLSVYPKIIKELEKYKIEDANKYKLSFIIESSIVKIYSNNCNNKDTINNTIKKYLKENVLLKKGNLKIKIKAIILLFFPKLYKIFKKIKEKENKK